MRLIDANALKKAIHNYFDERTSTTNENLIVKLIDNAPTIEQPQGEWIELSNYRHKCSICNNSADALANLTEQLSNFCPNCGAKMTQG